jgi:signal transduction histidine kinase/ActR/RegA family two-component response regulator
MPAQELTLTPDTPYTVYVQVHNSNIPLSFELKLRTADNLLQSAIMYYLFYGAILGGMLALAAYNFLTFLKLREASFLSLTLLILASSMGLSYLNGLLNHVKLFSFWFHSVPAIFTQIAVTSAASLFYQLMDIPRNLPAFRLPFLTLITAGLLSFPLAIFLPYDFLIAALLTLALLIIDAPATIILYRRGLHEAKSFAWAFGIMLPLILPVVLVGAGIIRNWPPAIDLMQLGILAFMVLLSLTQAERTRALREHSQRAEAASLAKGEFLASMSHEIRTPMNAVINTGVLLQQTPLTPVQRGYIDRLETASSHMLNLINDILDLSRLESAQYNLEKDPFTVGGLLGNLEQLLSEHALQQKLQLNLQSHFPPKTVLLGDPTRLSQILLNLLNNALKFTAQGHVDLFIREIMQAEQAKAVLHFEVADTGCGLTPQQQERLFEPFSPISQSTDKRYRGTGLGLCISHKLVEAMVGKLEVDSTPGEGSRFFFTLEFPLQTSTPVGACPASDPPASTAEESPAKLAPATDPIIGKNILLVDDDEMNQFFGQALLQTLGVTVSIAASGAEAIQQLHQQRFDLVFMDVCMPEMDGYETTRRIRAEPPFTNLPIIALTANALTGERERCLAAGMNDYLSKPFKVEQIRDILITYAATAHAQDSFQSG